MAQKRSGWLVALASTTVPFASTTVAPSTLSLIVPSTRVA
jgi:hypothetical protein